MKVAIYCRVSTQEQKKYGISIDEQKESLTKYCKKNNLTIYDYYIDNGISAGSISKRKELCRLLNDLDNIDMILFTKLDRFSRNVRDANNLLEELNKHNVSFKAIYDNLIDTSTADGKFTFNLLVSLGERERQLDGERIRKNFDYKYKVSKTVCSGAKIFGYDIIDKKYVVNEEEKQIIIDLYNHYIETSNISETIRWFNDKYFNICESTIKKYLSNEKYIGIFKRYSTNEIVDNYIPRLMDDNLFYQVQNRRKQNAKFYKDKKIDYIFSGLVECGNCHKMLKWNYQVKKTAKYKYCCCKTRVTLKQCDMKKHYSQSKLEEYLTNNILMLIEKEDLKIKTKTKNIKKKSPDIKNKMNKLTDLYMNDLIDIDKYKNDYKELEKQYNDALINEKSIVVPTKNKNLDIFKDKSFVELYNMFNEKEKNLFWHKVISKIVITNDEINVIFL